MARGRCPLREVAVKVMMKEILSNLLVVHKSGEPWGVFGAESARFYE